MDISSHFILVYTKESSEFPWWLNGKKIHLPMQETQVRSQGWDDPLEKEMAIHSCILPWIIPWTEDPGGLQSLGHKELDMTAVTYQ